MEVTHNNPRFLPDGRHFLYLRSSVNPENIGIYIGSLDAGPQEQSDARIVASSLGPGYAASGVAERGYLLFRREDALLAQPFDERTMALAGEPVVVAERLTSYFSSGQFSVSDNGVLVYRAGESARASRLVLFDRQGNTLAEPGEPGAYSNAAISPDGTRAIVRRTDYGSSDLNLWLVDFLGGTRRLTRERFSASSPVWAPKGDAIAFAYRGRNAIDLYRRAVDSTTAEELLLETDQDKAPLSWSHDGQLLLYASRDPETGLDLWVLPLTGERRPIPFATSEWDESVGRFSPDGGRVAYVSNESGREDVYIRTFAFDARQHTVDLGAITIVSRDGGRRPRWRKDGRELFYVDPYGALMSVEIVPGPTFRGAAPRPLFRLPAGTDVSDTDGDGRTLAVVPLDPGAQPAFNVVLNWQEELKQRMPTR